ncbi:hypothetical protein GCM10011611_17910 [Aliidongia dinghuensis]|uniref:DUF2092 domain-containing protein n=2 Tax=Aliidongia dinghuensis TaxID=1867774 RepID=A0A8J2YT38_9PROT|nr:hypothetical protein GCM10011611_17910 [Aliidongia dinghuensis]
MTAHHLLQVAALGVCVAFAALPTARAAVPVQPVIPGISEEAGSAIAQMGKTLSAKELSMTARTIRVYLDEAGQPLHIFQTMKVVVRRPNRLTVQLSGDDGSHDLFYDGKSASIFSPDANEYATIAAPADIPSALDEVQDKLNIDFPLNAFFSNAPDKSLLNDVVAGWQVGTASVDGVECRHLIFFQRAGVELELWVEKSSEARPHRMIVTYRLLPGQPNFIAEFTGWNTQVHSPDSEFAFQPPADAKKIELGPTAVPDKEGGK